MSRKSVMKSRAERGRERRWRQIAVPWFGLQGQRLRKSSSCGCFDIGDSGCQEEVAHARMKRSGPAEVST